MVFNLDINPLKSSFFQFIIGAKAITIIAGAIINVVVILKYGGPTEICSPVKISKNIG